MSANGPVPLLVVDAANVIGSRPDGWWRDRAGAVRRLRDQLAVALAEGTDFGRADARLSSGPEIVVVVEGAARSVEGVPDVEVVVAPGSGDDTIVDVVAERSGDGARPVVVVTVDRELRRRVADLGASTLGPRALLDLLAS